MAHSYGCEVSIVCACVRGVGHIGADVVRAGGGGYPRLGNAVGHNIATHNIATHNIATHNIAMRNIATHNIATHNIARLYAVSIRMSTAATIRATWVCY